jgi:hypothetical protein
MISLTYWGIVYLGGSSRRTLRVHDEHPQHLMVGPPCLAISCWLASRLRRPLWFSYCTAFLSVFLKIDSLSTSLISFGSEFHPSTTLTPKLFNLISVWANFFLIFHGFTPARVRALSSLCCSIDNDKFTIFYSCNLNCSQLPKRERELYKNWS